jgi:hypothetical protein
MSREIRHSFFVDAAPEALTSMEHIRNTSKI